MDTDTLRRQWLTLVAASLVLMLTTLNLSMVNLALPALRAAFGSGALEQQWVINAYNLVFASLLLGGGLLGDRLGHRQVLLAGLGVSLVATFTAALAPTIGVLLGARAVQGLGSALILPTTVALLADTFVEPRVRAKALGLWGAASGLGVASGPLLGGLLVDRFGWRTVFVALAVVGALALLATITAVRETSIRIKQRLDIVGLTLVVTTIATLSFGLSEIQRVGIPAPSALALLGGAALGLAVFLAVEIRTAAPLIELAAFRRPAFAMANIGGLLTFFGTFPLLTFTGILLQQDLGRSATETGFLLLAFPLAFSGASILGAQLLARSGVRLPVAVGALTSSFGALSLGWFDGSAPALALWWRLMLLGAGVGLSMSGLTTAAVSSVGPERAGMAASILEALRQLGIALGIAILGAIVTTTANNGATALLGFQRAAFVTAGLLGAAAISAAMWLPGSWRLAAVSGAKGRLNKGS